MSFFGKATLFSALLVGACAAISGDENIVDSYGYSKDNPIKVAGLSDELSARSEHLYLARLRGPNGERITYFRRGSCCAFDTPNSPMGMGGLLDAYEVHYENLGEHVVLYLNMYDPGEIRAPKGFTLVD